MIRSVAGLIATCVVLLGVAATIAVLNSSAMMAWKRRRADTAAAVPHTARAEVLIDPLTGLANRRRLDRDVGLLNEGAINEVAAMMVSIDDLVTIDERFGHQVGDDALRRVGEVLRRSVRSSDIVYRYGGDEFCLLLPATDATMAEQIAARLYRVLADDLAVAGLPVTVSIGVSGGSPPHVKRTIRAADSALGAAKRNRPAAQAPAR